MTPPAIEVPHVHRPLDPFPYRVNGSVVGTSLKNAKQVSVQFKYRNRTRSAKIWMKPEHVYSYSDGGCLQLTEAGFEAITHGVRNFIINEEDEKNL